jgi:hypothetical protein
MNTKVCLAILLLAGVAFAEPFLVADPMSEATRYRVRLSADNGTTWGSWVEGTPVNQAARFDLGGTPSGNYRGELQAYGSWRLTDSTSGQTSTVTTWTPSAPFLLIPPSSTRNIRVVDGN